MASGSKREKFKAFIRRPFSSNKKGKAVLEDVHHDTPTTPLVTSSSNAIADKSSPSSGTPKIVVHEPSLQAAAIPSRSGGGIFSNASHFSVNNPFMVDNSLNTTVNIHGGSDRRKAMEHLFAHIIHGAAHDSSARDPPPRCHPGTRIKINEHIITWFYDEEKQEFLIWVYGPAGVGKSAIMQTLAEKLAESKHLGASAFVSRPNGRNSSRQLFITIAYQLAVHIEDYCTFITDKLGRDPELVNKGMAEQFHNFIVEPFAEKQIGAGGHPWGVILDGLDELDEHQSQRAVIRLIADFVLAHPNVPLRWLIASRPEPHIIDTFDEENVAPAYSKKFVPANSKDSCRDVERFLRASLERTRKEFPRTVPKNWPSEEQISNLAAAASGLFVLADTAIRFIQDPRYANPTMRLGQVLSALNGLPASAFHSQPLAYLDALYTSILGSIPPDVWLTTKRVLGALLYAQGEGRRFTLNRLTAISVVLNLELSTIYASVNGCYSLLNTSDPEDAHWKPATFYHASFGDYLLDPIRSKHFCISLQDVEDDLLHSSLKIWQDFRTTFPPTPGLSYRNRWIKYFSASASSHHINQTFQFDLMLYFHEALFNVLVEKHDPKNKEPFSSEEDKDQCFALLGQLEDATMCHGFRQIEKLPEFLLWLFDLWELHQDELVFRGVVPQVGLKQVTFAQFQTCPAQMRIIQDKSTLKNREYTTEDFGDILTAVSQLESSFPQLPVLACGSPGKGCLLFRHQASPSDLAHHGLDAFTLQPEAPVWIYYAIPYPHSNFYHDAEHFLRDNLQAISAKYSPTIPKTWPNREQFEKLAGAVSHQFAFATMAIQFLKDPHHGDPMECLDQLVALINEVDPSADHPFVYVDALYSHILNSIPSDIWPTTQQVLGLFLYGITRINSALKSPKGVSVVLGIELSVVYAALSGCSMVQMPPENAYLENVVFHHPSFYEYLVDFTRSKKFHISLQDTRGHRLKLLINIWLDFKKFSHGVPDGHYQSTWNRYCSQHHSDVYPSNDSLVTEFNKNLLEDAHDAPFLSIQQYGPAKLKSRQNQDYVFHLLGQMDFTTIYRGFSWYYQHKLVIWLFKTWNTYEEELTSRQLFHEIQLQDFQFDHLEWNSVCPHVVLCNVGSKMEEFLGNDPRSPEELEEYISGLQLFQQHRPQLRVLIGGCPGDQFAVFEYEYTEDDLKERLHQPQERKQKAGDKGYYILPYPDQA